MFGSTSITVLSLAVMAAVSKCQFIQVNAIVIVIVMR